MNQAPRNRFTVHGRARAFTFALKGIWTMLREEPNSVAYGLITVGIIALGLWLEIGRYDWAIIFLAGGALWSAEAFNTAIERAADAVTLEHHPLIGKAKDVAAGAVLLASIGALVAVLFVLVPYFL